MLAPTGLPPYVLPLKEGKAKWSIISQGCKPLKKAFLYAFG